MEPKKAFWLLYSTTDFILGVLAPLRWWPLLGAANLLACWWVVFRSGWLP